MLQTKCLEQCPAYNKYSIFINTHSSTKDIKFEANNNKKKLKLMNFKNFV